jgi:hypothetical protein
MTVWLDRGSVTNTITSFGSHLGVSLFGTFYQWSCDSRVLVYLNEGDHTLGNQEGKMSSVKQAKSL